MRPGLGGKAMMVALCLSLVAPPRSRVASAGGLAHPGVLWLVGEAARQRVEVARAGWVVAEVGA